MGPSYWAPAVLMRTWIWSPTRRPYSRTSCRSTSTPSEAIASAVHQRAQAGRGKVVAPEGHLGKVHTVDAHDSALACHLPSTCTAPGKSPTPRGGLDLPALRCSEMGRKTHCGSASSAAAASARGRRVGACCRRRLLDRLRLRQRGHGRLVGGAQLDQAGVGADGVEVLVVEVVVKRLRQRGRKDGEAEREHQQDQRRRVEAGVAGQVARRQQEADAAGARGNPARRPP